MDAGILIGAASLIVGALTLIVAMRARRDAADSLALQRLQHATQAGSQPVEPDELRMIRLIHDHGPLIDSVSHEGSLGANRAAYSHSGGRKFIDRDAEGGRAIKAMQALNRKGLARQVGNPYILTDEGREVYRFRTGVELTGPDFVS